MPKKPGATAIIQTPTVPRIKAKAPTYEVLKQCNTELRDLVNDLQEELVEVKEAASCTMNCLQEATYEQLVQEISKRCIVLVHAAFRDHTSERGWTVRFSNDEHLVVAGMNALACSINKQWTGSAGGEI